MASPKKVAPKIAAKERGPGPGRYLLPNVIGTDNIDVRKQIKPCYTFGTHVSLLALGNAREELLVLLV